MAALVAATLSTAITAFAVVGLAVDAAFLVVATAAMFVVNTVVSAVTDTNAFVVNTVAPVANASFATVTLVVAASVTAATAVALVVSAVGPTNSGVIIIALVAPRLAFMPVDNFVHVANATAGFATKVAFQTAAILLV